MHSSEVRKGECPTKEDKRFQLLFCNQRMQETIQLGSIIEL